ncbi:hypothetical protein [Chryseosolibacter indicus]|uniref:Protein SirB1 N-terminal domain-containing protein n=1 Tax=Chryseosolibacter indicus TaxID=2782351 RepID=A0ABS5VWK4_9BACT|nr:hypothetical protein [Chryseosolibacter indicus]MBT1705807.1 hypothetical protein [Chryseosolibacter indicus]
MNISKALRFSPLALIFLPSLCLSQVTSPQPSSFNTIKLHESGSYYTNSALQAGHLDNQRRSMPLGANSSDIIAQQNVRAMQQMGYRGRPQVPPSDPTLLHQFIVNGAEVKYNNTNHLIEEVLIDLNQIRADEEGRFNSINLNHSKSGIEKYEKAKLLLSDMLTGKVGLSLKDAFFILESAYGNCHLTYNEFNLNLKRSADFIKQWLTENGYDNNNNTAVHLGIQAFMRDTLTISKINTENSALSKTQHLPFSYDYVDFRAEEDFRNYFVTKTLATGYGQCNSLPATYILLAEQLGVKAYLSYAPLHSFIKFPDSKGVIHNYEVTSHYQITDQWYSDHFGITTTARRSRIYLDTLNSRQIVAGALMDLAFGYLRKYGVSDGHFINECVAIAMRHFPNQEGNIQGWLLRSTVLSAMLHRVLQREQIRDLNEIERSPEASKLYNQLLAIQNKLQALGYQELPTEIYHKLIGEQDNKALLQRNTYETKTKRDLFTTLK